MWKKRGAGPRPGPGKGKGGGRHAATPRRDSALAVRANARVACGTQHGNGAAALWPAGPRHGLIGSLHRGSVLAC